MKTAFLSAGDSAKFKITDTKLHVPIVTLFIVNLTKQLSDEFKKSVYWSNYQTVLERVINKGTNMYELLTFQDVKRLFVLAYVLAQNAPNNEACLLGDLLTRKWLFRACCENKERKGILRTCYGYKDFQFKNILIPLHPLTNFKTQNYYQNKRRFNDWWYWYFKFSII